MTEIGMLSADNLPELHSAMIDTVKVVTVLQKKPLKALGGSSSAKAID